MDDRQESVGFGRAVQISPWLRILTSIYEELDPAIVGQLIDLYNPDADDKTAGNSRDGPEKGDTVADHRRQFFNCVNKGEDTYASAKSLQEKLEDLDIHDEWGEKWDKKVQDIIDQLTKFYESFKVDLHGIFLGRQKELQDLKEELEKSSVKCVCISGLTGQGKSTMARHLLLSMYNDTTSPWSCVVVDARDEDTTDMMVQRLAQELKDTAEFDFQSFPKEPNSFVAEVLKSTMSKTVWLLDNCDRVYEEDKRMFLRFLEESIMQLQTLGTSGKPKVKLLVTMRQEIDTMKFHSSNSTEVVQKILPPLPEEDAVTLLTMTAEKSYPDEEEILTDIVKECACSPYAVSIISGLLRNDNFTPRKLRYHLKHDTKNVTKVLSVKDCIKEAIESLPETLKIAVIKLSVFKTKPFTKEAGVFILSHKEQDPLSCSDLEALLKRNLLEQDKAARTYSRRKSSHEEEFNMQPLVHRYLVEWDKPKRYSKYKDAMADAFQAFLEYFEKKICRIVTHMTDNALKAVSELQENRSHIVEYYNVWAEKKMIQKPYTKEVTTKDVLVKLKVAECVFLSKLISDVKKRRIFAFESERARAKGSDPFQIFWKVQEANVLVVQHDKAGIALEELDQLSKQFPQLMGLANEPVFTFMVHASFHTVKGKCLTKQHEFQEAINHFDLAKTFYDKGKQEKFICALKNRVLKYIGLVFLEKGDFLKAEQRLNEAFQNSHVEPAKVQRGSTKISRRFSIELPEYKGYFGVIELKKALSNTEQKERHLIKAMKYLEDGLKLDEQLKMDKLDGFAYKMMYFAEVLLHLNQIDSAISCATSAMDQRREMLQLPHFGVTECVYQMARLHTIKAQQVEDEGKAKRQLLIASDYFDELENHHLLYGGIAVDHPMVQGIKRSHLEVLRYLKDDVRLQKSTEFYRKLLAGELSHEAEAAIADFKRMTHTVTELMAMEFMGGGREFGEKNVFVTRDGPEQGGRDSYSRKDSALGLPSTDGEGSLSMSSESESLSERMAQAHLESSVSLEDEIFEQGTVNVAPESRRKPPLKRVRNIEED